MQWLEPAERPAGAGADATHAARAPGHARHKWRAQQPEERPKPHDLANLVTSGYLERLHFKYRPATPATMFRHPSSLGMRP